MNWRQPGAGAISWIKAVVFLLCLLPAVRLGWAAWTGDFGPNPVEFLQRFTGTWTFNFLLLTLAVSPLRAWTQAHWLLRLRRMLGLYVFFYAALHFLAFIGFDHGFDLDSIARDIVERPFVTVGFAAFVLLVPLAATSNQFSIRRLGGRRWQDLHRTVYLIGILAAVHYFWLVKWTAILYPVVYSAILAALLAWRVKDRLRRAAQPSGKKPGAQVQPIHFHRQRPGK